MVRQKNIRDRGKIQLSKYFQRFNDGDSVTVVKELSVSSSFPERIQGRTGIIEGKRGRSYVIKIGNHGQEKKFIIEPVHLKKINTGKNTSK